MQPIIMFALIGVAALATSVGFLNNTFVLNVQSLGVAETDLASPIQVANIDLELAKKTAAPDADSTRTHFHNVIDKCSFHSPQALGVGSTIICKLTDLDDDVIAEGKTVLRTPYPGSLPGFFVDISQTAYPWSNDVQKVHDVKIVVLGPKPGAFTSCANSIDFCVDGDGIASSGRGAFSVTAGAILTAWPTTQYIEGIDGFNIPGGVWSNAVGGSDIHLEDPAGSCSLTAIRQGVHDTGPSPITGGQDCPVLDLDGSLFDQQVVECDFETGTFCTGAVPVKFVDSDGNGFWDNGEDIIQDVNGNGVFD